MPLRLCQSLVRWGKVEDSDFSKIGRDPVTNVAERLKWDREKFDKLKKYVNDRMAQK